MPGEKTLDSGQRTRTQIGRPVPGLQPSDLRNNSGSPAPTLCTSCTARTGSDCAHTGPGPSGHTCASSFLSEDTSPSALPSSLLIPSHPRRSARRPAASHQRVHPLPWAPRPVHAAPPTMPTVPHCCPPAGPGTQRCFGFRRTSSSPEEAESPALTRPQAWSWQRCGLNTLRRGDEACTSLSWALATSVTWTAQRPSRRSGRGAQPCRPQVIFSGLRLLPIATVRTHHVLQDSGGAGRQVTVGRAGSPQICKQAK